jgi:hypothetical protein
MEAINKYLFYKKKEKINNKHTTPQENLIARKYFMFVPLSIQMINVEQLALSVY